MEKESCEINPVSHFDEPTNEGNKSNRVDVMGFWKAPDLNYWVINLTGLKST